MESFDIGILGFTYNSAGVFLDSIQIVKDNPLGGWKVSNSTREEVISWIQSNKRICLARRGPDTTIFMQGRKDPFIALTSVFCEEISGIKFIKATYDTGPCDDLG